MLHIAVVDDDRIFSVNVEDLIKKVIEKLNDRCKIYIYHDGNILLEEIKQKKIIDLFFLDIEMQEINGLELAKKIKAEDKCSYIIFISAFPKYAISSYKIHAFYYILKKEYKTELPLILKEIWQKNQADRAEYYIIQNESYGKRMRLDDIIYLQREKKYVCFQCIDGEVYKERGALGNIYEKLPHDKFVYIDKGEIINLKHVARWDGDRIILNNGLEFYASRRMIKSFKDAILKYWRE